MKKVFLSFCFFAITVFGCSRIEYDVRYQVAQRVKAFKSIDYNAESEFDAKDVVMSFICELDKSSRNGQTRTIESVEYSDGLYDEKEGKVLSSPVFIVNFDGEAGFAIVSVKPSLPPVLCVVDTGHFHNGEELPLGAIAVLSRAEESFVNNKNNERDAPWNSFPQDSVEIFWTTLNVENTHGNRLACNWGQSPKFNNHCPVLSNGDRAYAGCLPIAVAQIMYYHGKNATYGGYYYDWSIMHQIVNANSCPMYAGGWYNVAKFVRALGDSTNLRASYNIGGTPSKWARAPQTFLNFDYSNGGVCTDYNYWNLSYDIVHGYPVLLCGSSDIIIPSNVKSQSDTSYTSTHAWVADQFVRVLRRVEVYNKYTWDLIYTADVYQYYIHCNWGWNGWYNGFFLSEHFDYLDPLVIPNKSQVDTINGTAFKYLLRQITGIRP